MNNLTLPKNKTQLAELMGIKLQPGIDLYTWDLESDDIIIFLVAQDELKELEGIVELYYRVERDSNHVRKQNCLDRLERVNKVLFGEKKGYLLVRADTLSADTRDSHQWKLVNDLMVYPVIKNGMTMAKNCKGQGWVGWLEFDYFAGVNLRTLV
ncbi:hypothetical protein ACE1OE_08315 [Vibrio sp. E150_011]